MINSTINKYFLLVIIGFFLTKISIAQNKKDEIPMAHINLMARYKDKTNTVELRFLADKKSVLYAGLKNGFVIERAEINGKISKLSDIHYFPIGKSQAYSKKEWSLALFGADGEIKNRLEFAQNFYENIGKSDKQKPKFENDFGSLRAAKKANDFEFVMIALTALQYKKTATALGLSYLDESVQKGKKYVYRVKLSQYNGPYKVIEIPYLITAKKESLVIKRPIEVVEGDSKLGFTWEENDLVSGVWVERKNLKTGNYERLNEALKMSLSEDSFRNGFEDTNLTNYQMYAYKFYGMNVFGEKVLFGEVKAMPKDKTPPNPPIMLGAKQIEANKIKITWEAPSPVSKDLKGFRILKSNTVDSNYTYITQMISTSARAYTDININKKVKNFYLVEAVDTSGNVSLSLPAYAMLTDTIPPAIPKIIKAEMDSSGIVTIIVQRNKEKDLMGYRLFMANDPEHHFSPIQEGFDSKSSKKSAVQLTFKDTVTLKTLSPYVYYRVKALDTHHNQSSFSEISKVKRIDIIPPSTPVFKGMVVYENQIELSFALSKSLDVKAQYLYQKTNKNDKWSVVTKLKKNQDSYRVTGLKTNKTYYFSLRARDDSDLYSDYAVPVMGIPFDSGKRPTIDGFSIKKNKNKLSLSWNYSKNDDRTYFVIYRSNSEGKLVQYKSTSATQFEDVLTKIKRQYAIKVFTKDGGQSKLSKILSYPPL